MTSKKWKPPEGNILQFKRYERRMNHANLAQDGDDRLLIPKDLSGDRQSSSSWNRENSW